MKICAMIPARMGSQRLKQKNLREIDGISILERAVRKCLSIDLFNEVWVNSESDVFGEIGIKAGAQFHKRPDELANNHATSEDFVYEFLKKHDCDFVIQVHSIAPLLRSDEIEGFVKNMVDNDFDTQLSVVIEQIECAMNNKPVNFTLDTKTNSQELDPIQRITWSITGWKKDAFINAYEQKKCATYSGNVNFYPISREAGHIIKKEEDFILAEALAKVLD